MSNDFPKLGINTQELLDQCRNLIDRAKTEEDVTNWGVNWADIGVASIEYRKEMLNADSQPYCAVILEEASPSSELAQYVYNGLKERFPSVSVECEW